VFEADIDKVSLVSDDTWKLKVHPAFCDTGEPYPNFRLPESNIRFDARKDIGDWQKASFQDDSWGTAEEYGVPPCAPWNCLVKRPIPMWKDYGLKAYTNDGDFPDISDGNTIVAKLAYNAQITPYLNIEAPAGLVIDIRTDNYRGGGDNNVRAEYVTRQGIQEYENLGWMSGHAVHYTIPAGIRILSLGYRETGYDTEFAGLFECDDEFVNNLCKKAVRTLYISMRDTYMDCPDRERAQWWGDEAIELGQAFYALDSRSRLLGKKGILELVNWQRSDGTLFFPVPAGNWDKELPTVALASVGYYGFWTYFLYTGDVNTARLVYPGVKRYLALWKRDRDGLVVHRKGGWTWVDWGENKDTKVLYNAWYYLALKGQQQMAELLGLNRDVTEIEKEMSVVRETFNKKFWTGSEYRSLDYEGITDERGQALAVVSGLAGPDKYDAIRAVLKSQYNCSVYMEKYVLEALYTMGFADDAIERLKRRYSGMVQHWHSTLWEGWSFGPERRNTINHGWSGGPLTVLFQYGAGVAPEKPGYELYHVLPQMGPLSHIATTIPSIKGNINLMLERSGDSFSLALISPAGTEAIVGIPRGRGGRIIVEGANGSELWEPEGVSSLQDGIDFAGNDHHYHKFRLKPGKWHFRTESVERK
jgi:hypothetical protein